MDFTAEIFGILKTKAMHMPIRPRDMEAFVNDLQCLLDIIKASNHLYINDGSIGYEQLCGLQEEVEWKQCKTRCIREDCN